MCILCRSPQGQKPAAADAGQVRPAQVYRAAAQVQHRPARHRDTVQSGTRLPSIYI